MLEIKPADLTHRRTLDLLETHVTKARAETARGSAHALDPTALQSPLIDVWAVWEGETLAAIGALMRIGANEGELKSMHVAQAMRGRGIGSLLLRHLIEHARRMELARLYLETGSWDHFGPARRLYGRHGFVECPPFAGYLADPNSVFMTLRLADSPLRSAADA